jgi:aryl-alcohol dehydrogenase-like predicted oxidoreductase
MRYNRLGTTGLLVSELCLGTMTFGGAGPYSVMGDVTQDDANGQLRTALDAGVNFVDTANVYSQGLAEEITGKALKQLGLARHDVVIATKFFNAMSKGINDRGGSRAHILSSINASLARLQLDYVDLYQIHSFDPLTPMEETVRALDDVVRSGRVRYIGVSNWAAWQIALALGISDRLGLNRFVSVQAHYAAATRDIEREIVPMLDATGLGLLVWSPLSGGFLSGKVSRTENPDETSRRGRIDFPPVNQDRAFAVIDAMRPMADAHGVSVARVALAWVLQQPRVTSVIIGAKRAEQLADTLAACDLALTDDELLAISKAGALVEEYPGWMIRLQQARAGRDPIPAR